MGFHQAESVTDCGHKYWISFSSECLGRRNRHKMDQSESEEVSGSIFPRIRLHQIIKQRKYVLCIMMETLAIGKPQKPLCFYHLYQTSFQIGTAFQDLDNCLCPGISWDRVNFIPSSWYDNVLWIQDENNVDKTLMYWLLLTLSQGLLSFLYCPAREETEGAEEAERGQNQDS